MRTRKLGVTLAVLLVAAGAGAFAALGGWPSGLGGTVTSAVPPPGYGNAGDDAARAPSGPVAEAPSGPVTAAPADPAVTGPAPAGPVAAGPAPAPSGPAVAAPASSGAGLVLSGDLDGPIIVAGEVTCTPFPGSTAYSWRLVGSLDRAPITLSFTSNNYTGPGTYNATGVTDERGGFLALDLGGTPYGSNGASRGTFTVTDPSAGSIDADVSGPGGRVVHIRGPWRCPA